MPSRRPGKRDHVTLRERFLSLRLLEAHDASVAACCVAWNAIADHGERIRSLYSTP